LVFPGGYLPSFTLIIQTLNKGSAGRLIVDSVLNIGPHYARTLREWKYKFLATWDTIFAKAPIEQYDLDLASLEIFKRHDYCEAGFRTRMLDDHIVTFTWEGHVAFSCGV
ncbi:hypothetical protein FB451DRAFT_1013013, partial [Mycena latifolia]